MQKLSSGYRLVGGLSAVFGAGMAGLLVSALLVSGAPSHDQVVRSGNARQPQQRLASPWPKDMLDWFRALTLVLSPLALVVAGVLFYTKQVATLRAARWALGIAGFLLLLAALVMTLGVIQEFKHPTSSTGVLVIVAVPLFVMPATIWAIVVLLTAVFLNRHLHGSP